MPTNILVVDDSQIERLLVEALLRKNPDYHVTLAGGGREALQRIVVDQIGLVITDLFMPEMNGLELVRTMRNRHPDIPVVLMTAYGDEAIASEALEAGAASYVPKARKAERLVSTVARIADHARGNQNRKQLSRCMLDYHCRFSLPNERDMIGAVATEIEEAMAGMRFGDVIERIRIGEALEEALLNSMYHGNLEISAEDLARVHAELDENLLRRLVEERCREERIRCRRISFVAHMNHNEAKFVIRNEGRGFKSSLDFKGDSDVFECGHQRGMTLIQSLMDDVMFNQTGNELVMRKRFRHVGEVAI